MRHTTFQTNCFLPIPQFKGLDRRFNKSQTVCQNPRSPRRRSACSHLAEVSVLEERWSAKRDTYFELAFQSTPTCHCPCTSEPRLRKIILCVTLNTTLHRQSVPSFLKLSVPPHGPKPVLRSRKVGQQEVEQAKQHQIVDAAVDGGTAKANTYVSPAPPFMISRSGIVPWGT